MKKVKGLISVLLGAVMTVSLLVPAYAADSDKLQTALAGVKGRIDIPAELSVFRSGVNTYDNKTKYSFTWTNEEESERIRITADEQGRVESYYYYEDSEDDAVPALADITRDGARELADEFLQKAAPELFSNVNDSLVFDLASGSPSGGRTWYSFSYERKHGDAKVSENNASVSIEAYGDKAYVSNMHINWDYDTQFADSMPALENPPAAYFAAFPLELAYQRRYSNKPIVLSTGIKVNQDVIMQYSFKDGAGYISAETGEVLEPDGNNDYRVTGSSGGGSSKNYAIQEAAADMVSFTSEELAEIERVEGIISDAEAEKILRTVTELKLTNDMKLTSVNIIRQRPWYYSSDNDVDKEKFCINIELCSMDGEKIRRNAYASIDAETGEIKSISNYGWYEEDKDSTGDAQKEIPTFLQSVVPEKLAQLEEVEKVDGKLPLNARMRRIINSIPYNGNYISYSYNEEYSRISGYSLVWDDYTDYFANPADAIGTEAAQAKVLEYAPLEYVYIKNGGVFRLCHTISQEEYYTVIDALTGKQLNVNREAEQAAINYSDIDGHWAAEAIKRLADAGLCEAVDKFRPDDKMTQKELLTLLANAFNGGSYGDWGEDEFYDMLVRRGCVEKDDKRPQEQVLREDAFVYMIRFMGYDRVAKLTGIYSCDYTDAAELSPEKTGYAAILTGFGVVSGDALALRAKDNVTRAEAAMMVYKYLTYKE